MRTLSNWASKNVNTARIVLVMVLLLIAIMSWIAGTFIAISGFLWATSTVALYLTALLLPIIIVYPSRQQIKKIGLGKQYFKKWKIYDFSLVLLFGAICTTGGNYATNHSMGDLTSVKSISVVIEKIPTMQVMAGYSRLQSNNSRISNILNLVQKKVVKFVSTLKEKAEKRSNILNTITIFFLIIGYFVLFYTAALVACGLGCNGFGIAAVLMFFVVQVALLFGFYFAIRRLLKDRRENFGQEPLTRRELKSKSFLFTASVFLFPIVLAILNSF